MSRPEANEIGRVLCVRDVASILRVSPSTARAWLVGLEERSAGQLVHRRGRKLCITEQALRSALSGGASESALRRRLAALEQSIRRLTRRVQELELLVPR